jgi:F0F1-type ATP synthase assembly protein I
MKFAKFGKVAGPVFIALDGVFRTNSVIEKYNANDPTWKREAVVQSTGFVGGVGVGVLIGSAIALTPVGLVAGMVIGGVAAFGADHLIKAGVENMLGWFD